MKRNAVRRRNVRYCRSLHFGTQCAEVLAQTLDNSAVAYEAVAGYDNSFYVPEKLSAVGESVAGVERKRCEPFVGFEA